jgi:epoxide hydrolase-like predicted phosphatase
MIKGILFDYGGVVAKGGKGIDAMRRLCNQLNRPETDVDDLFMPLFSELIRGKIDEPTFWNSIEQKTGLTINEAQREAWNSNVGTTPYPAMVELIKSLRSGGYSIGLLSNITPPAKERIDAAGGYSLFDFVVLSCEAGYAKPEAEIYDLAMALFKDLQPEEIVFIDDQEKCMPPAEALGMGTILATSSEQIIDELQKLGVKTD